MEESKNQILQPRKLNLDVPPLSTRRPSASSNLLMLSKSVTNNMIPFSWERIPGEPKDKPSSVSSDHPPPPRPPPGSGQPGGDGNSGDGEYRNERFSDGIDIFSLAESGDDTEGNWNGRSAERDDAPCSGYGSSNFIIQRFLPDAQALAEASVMNKECPFSDSPSFARAVSIGRTQHALKGCGLGSFLPWRMKPKPCSVKSPVCDTIIGPGPNVKQKRV